MEIKVKAVDSPESKSIQEVEKVLLEKHEEALSDEAGETNMEGVDESTESATTTEEQEDIQTEVETQAQSSELNEEDVLSYIKNRYDKQIDSVEELFSKKESNEELPEDVSAYLKYKQETGRGFEDFVKLQQNFDEMSPDDLLESYYKATEIGLDDDDIDIMLDEFDYDEDIDAESDIKKIKLAKKKAIGKAKRFFNEQKEDYYKPLESSTAVLPEEEKKKIEEVNQYIEQAKSYEEEQSRRREWFLEKTDEVFSDFKGFDFKIGDDQTLTYTPTNAEEVKKINSDTNNFMKKFVDEKGVLTDAAGYHKALAIAMNPDRYAKFFYEQGLSAGTEDVTKKIKNINMSERNAPEVTNKGGVQIRAINPDSGKGLKIRSIKNKN